MLRHLPPRVGGIVSWQGREGSRDSHQAPAEWARIRRNVGGDPPDIRSSGHLRPIITAVDRGSVRLARLPNFLREPAEPALTESVLWLLNARAVEAGATTLRARCGISSFPEHGVTLVVPGLSGVLGIPRGGRD